MMQSFVQYTPTKVVFGKDTQKEAGKLVSELGITKVFLVYGGGSVIRSGLLDEIKKSLDEEHISYEELGGVKPNPRLSFARKGVEKAIAFGAELISRRWKCNRYSKRNCDRCCKSGHRYLGVLEE